MDKTGKTYKNKIYVMS